MRIAVAGGTGRVGTPVVAAVRATGHEPVVLSRSNGVDVTTGAGLAGALDGASALIDVSNVTTIGRRKSVAFFEAAARHIIQAGQRAGVAHLVVLSIVGVDRVDTGYYAGKRRQEDLALSGGIPASVLRATQFHEFIAQLLERERGPVALVPRMRSQPVAAREVASALVDLALGEPAGMAPEIAGPEPLEMTDMARRFLGAKGLRRMVVPVRVPGPAGRAMASGALLPTGPGPRGQETFGQWLTSLSPAAGQP